MTDDKLAVVDLTFAQLVPLEDTLADLKLSGGRVFRDDQHPDLLAFARTAAAEVHLSDDLQVNFGAIGQLHVGRAGYQSLRDVGRGVE